MAQNFLLLMKTYSSYFSGLPFICWQRIFLFFIVTTTTGFSFFLSLYFVSSLHFNIELVGALITCYGVGLIFGGIVGGKLSDKISPYFISVASLFMASFSYAFMLIIKEIFLIAINLFLMGFVSNSFRTANNVKTLGMVKNNEELKVINILAIAYNLGLALSGVLVSFFGNYGFKTIFIFASFVLLGCLVYLFIIEKNTLKVLNIKSIQNNNKQIKNKSNDQKNIKVLFTTLGCLLVFGFLVAQLGATYSIYINSQFSELGLKSFGYLFVLNTILVIFLQAPMGNSLPFTNKILVMGIGIFLYTFGFFILNFTFSIYSLAVISCVVYTFGEMLFYPRAQLLVYQHGEDNKKGDALGMFQTVYAAGIVIGPILGGFMYHRLGGSFLWNFSGVMGLLCLIACIFHRKNG